MIIRQQTTNLGCAPCTLIGLGCAGNCETCSSRRPELGDVNLHDVADVGVMTWAVIATAAAAALYLFGGKKKARKPSKRARRRAAIAAAQAQLAEARKMPRWF